MLSRSRLGCDPMFMFRGHYNRGRAFDELINSVSYNVNPLYRIITSPYTNTGYLIPITQ